VSVRRALTYDAARTATPVSGGIDVSVPVAGFYRTKLRGGGVAVGIRIFFGPPCDPETGEEMDRSHRWQAHCNGQFIEIDRVWPECARQQIDAKEYAYLSRLQAWAKEHAPNSPEADPRKPVNWLTAPLNI